MRLSTTDFSKPCAPCCLARKISAVPPSAILRRMVYRDCRLILPVPAPVPQSTTRFPSLGRLPIVAHGTVRAADLARLVIFLARRHRDLEAVLLGRQRARRVRRERAVWEVRAVEVDDERAVGLPRRAHEA